MVYNERAFVVNLGGLPLPITPLLSYSNSTMRAARILSEGSISNIEVVEELTKPVPKPGEALIRIKAAGVNGVSVMVVMIKPEFFTSA
jgi:hypothetical protein